jgi:hypothetical protein
MEGVQIAYGDIKQTFTGRYFYKKMEGEKRKLAR